MLKAEVKTKSKKGIYYCLDRKNRLIKYKTWKGDLVAFAYDSIMKKNVFPKKFQADMDKHYEILKKSLQNVHNCRILELAAGSGSMVNFLPPDNEYCGTDISLRLLRRALPKLNKYGFNNYRLFVMEAENLPLEDNYFHYCLCIISLNFFENLTLVIKEIKRLLQTKGWFIGVVPVPEKKNRNSVIHGKLYSQQELKYLFEKQGFSFETISEDNGALLYFKAHLKQK